MSEEIKNNKITKSTEKKTIIAIVAVLVILLVAAVGTGVYNAPANRIARQLDLGNRYLEDEQYEEAILVFERVIEIDDHNMEAYAVAAEAYLGKGDQEELEAFYDQALAVLTGLDEAFISQNMGDVVAVYLVADRVYEAEPQKAVQVLEQGYAQTGADDEIEAHLIQTYLRAAANETDAKKAAQLLEDALVRVGENQEIKAGLVQYYLKAAEEAAADSYGDALTMYDRLLELDSANAETVRELCSCLDKYIDDLMESKQFDTIRTLAEKYGKVAADVDFAAVLARVEELEVLEAENGAFMQKVYELMAAGDYEGMHGVDGSEEAEAFVDWMESDRYIYFPDDNESESGTGAGVYTFGDGGYYFYYGAFENGERKGDGTEFLNNGTYTYSVYAGAWDKDAPNGAGVLTQIGQNDNASPYHMVESGTLVNGLWDGEVKVILTDNSDGQEYDLSFSADNGVPARDLTQEWFFAKAWSEDEEYLDKGEYIYAYDYNQYKDYGWWLKAREGQTVGIDGFDG